MRASTITKALTAGSANAIATSQSLVAAGYLTLNGALVSGGVAVLTTGRQILIHSAADDSGLTWTVIGTNESGWPIKDRFAGANAGDATSNLLDFKTVTSIYASGATAGNVTAGTNGVGASDWKMFGDTINTPHIAFDTELVTGSANWSVQYTQEPFLTPIPASGSYPSIANADPTPNPTAIDFPNMSGLSASGQGYEDFVFHAWRLKINSGTGTVRCTGRQAGLASP